MKLFLSNGFVAMIAIALILSGSTEAIAFNTHAENDGSNLSLSSSVNSSHYQTNHHLPRPKGSR
jgi:hypothetical protein